MAAQVPTSSKRKVPFTRQTAQKPQRTTAAPKKAPAKEPPFSQTLAKCLQKDAEQQLADLNAEWAVKMAHEHRRSQDEVSKVKAEARALEDRLTDEIKQLRDHNRRLDMGWATGITQHNKVRASDARFHAKVAERLKGAEAREEALKLEVAALKAQMTGRRVRRVEEIERPKTPENRATQASPPETPRTP